MATATIQTHYLFQPRRNVVNKKRLFSVAFLVFCLSVIAAVSAIDIWFAVANSSIMIVEKNPICLALMKLDPDGFSFFVSGKAAGTLLVILTLLYLHKRNYQHAMKVTIAVASFQIGLLVFLTISDPMMYNLPNPALLFGDSPESVWRINDDALALSERY